MSFPRYPKYKDSGVEWLGEVPEHWEISPMKNLLDIRNGSDHKEIEVAEGYPVLGSGGIFSYASSYLYDGESVLFGRKGTIDKPLHFRGKFWTVDTMFWSILCHEHCGRFIYYAALTIPFQYYSTNTALPSMTKESLRAHRLAVPPLAEQHAIASFLDRETAKIDALIAEQQRLIELLQEKRQAVISHAVTKGLNPDAPMKDSGIEWLGEVPAHWEVMKIGRLLVEFPKNGLSPEITNSGTTPTFSIAAVRGGRVDIESHLKYCDVTLDKASPYFVAQGDIFVLRGSGSKDLVGTAGTVLDLPPRNCIYPDILIRLRPSQQLTPWFLVHSLNCPIIRPQIVVAAQTAAGIWKIAGGELREIRIPLPPVAEQVKIESKITIASATMNNLINSAETSLTLLQERRSALISAAVTGQIDVRGLAPREAA